VATPRVSVIGAGLAGSEASLRLAAAGFSVDLYDIKPSHFTPAHKNPDFCELVCSNSLKSNDVTTASGLLKEEIKRLGSYVIAAADANAVPAGGALAVDREAFARAVTLQLKENPNIRIINREITDLDLPEPIIIAAGPLVTQPLADAIRKYTGDFLYFYDASAPIVDAESIDFDSAFMAARYNKGGADYVNCPLSRDEYYNFVRELAAAERVEAKDFEKISVFEGCMPIEILASRGEDSLRFGPLKPVGIYGKDGKRPFAVVQLRAENAAKIAYNLVGFQTNLTYAEQRRVFTMIPALHTAEFLRYGVMHRNTFLNAPKVLEYGFRLKGSREIYIAGQLSGVEGYCESIMSGLVAAENVIKYIIGEDKLSLSPITMTGALIAHLATENADFQPMNANFGILPLLGHKVRDKRERYAELAERALGEIDVISTEASQTRSGEISLTE